jgi:hypothetical protein
MATDTSWISVSCGGCALRTLKIRQNPASVIDNNGVLLAGEVIQCGTWTTAAVTTAKFHTCTDG